MRLSPATIKLLLDIGLDAKIARIFCLAGSTRMGHADYVQTWVLLSEVRNGRLFRPLLGSADNPSAGLLAGADRPVTVDSN